jgi:hypothetical protein
MIEHRGGPSDRARSIQHACMKRSAVQSALLAGGGFALLMQPVASPKARVYLLLLLREYKLAFRL